MIYTIFVSLYAIFTESDPVYVLFSNRHEIRRVNIVSKTAVSLKSGLKNTIALDFYYNKQGQPILFWTDVMEDKIYRGTMQGNSELYCYIHVYYYLVLD